MPSITMRELLEAGVHFGHQTSHWNPRMKNYVFGARNGIYIIDLQKTADHAKKACEFVRSVTAEGRKVLFVGTKKQAKAVVEEHAIKAEMPFVSHRWLGGMLTNYQTVKASIDRLQKLEKLKVSDEWNEIPKKEQARHNRDLEKLNRSLGGITDMKKLPGAMFVVDVQKEHIAVKEAKKLGIPVVAVVDTNCDPTGVDYVIPGNDDAIRSVQLFARLVSDSCLEGEKIFQEKLKSQKVVVEEEKVEEKVSRFEGDLDIQGIDEADLAAEEAAEAEAELKADAQKVMEQLKKEQESEHTTLATAVEKEGE